MQTIQQKKTGLLTQWLTYLFQSTNGLVLVAISVIAVVAAVWGTLSGPMAEMGV